MTANINLLYKVTAIGLN